MFFKKIFFIDKRYLNHFDWVTLLLVFLLSLVGLAFVFSSTYTCEVPFSTYFKKQLFGIISGLILFFIFTAIDYRTLMRLGYFLYFTTIVLLIITIIKGSIGMGAKRWINLGIFKFQPSELTKLFFPPFLSYYLYCENSSGEFKTKDILIPFLVLGFTLLLILKQPDLGTALIILFSSLILFWLAGASKKFFLIFLILGFLGAPIIWNNLKEYQKTRILVFLGHGESKKQRYQIEQSLIAIGSGGLFGKGFLNGTQNRYMFLPEKRTDFIFAVMCEEIGFLGTFLIIILYIILFFRLIYITFTINNFFAQILAFGLVIHIIISTFVNISMVMGLLPVVGIPLPFMTYGISHIWITFASLGWFNSIATRRFYISIRT